MNDATIAFTVIITAGALITVLLAAVKLLGKFFVSNDRFDELKSSLRSDTVGVKDELLQRLNDVDKSLEMRLNEMDKSQAEMKLEIQYLRGYIDSERRVINNMSKDLRAKLDDVDKRVTKLEAKFDAIIKGNGQQQKK